MGSKLAAPSVACLKYIYDFDLNPQAGVGAVDVGDLPQNFVVESVYVQQLKDVTATTTIAVGPTADPDGFLAAVDLAATQKGAGALQAADADDIDYVVPADQKLLLTTAVAAAVTGQVAVIVKGIQLF